VTSKLASLLVQEGLVSPKKVAEAFQRQVIYGGTLDTILLEMDAIDEPTLVEAMGRASGLPTAGDLPSRAELERAGAASWFPATLSEKFRAVPIALDGNVVRVLVLDPPDRKQLDELGYQLSRSIDPIVVPEHRFVHAVEMVYGVSVPARFHSLAAKVRRRLEDLPTRRTPIVATAPAPETDLSRPSPPPVAPTVTSGVVVSPTLAVEPATSTRPTAQMPLIEVPSIAPAVTTPEREPAAPTTLATEPTAPLPTSDAKGPAEPTHHDDEDTVISDAADSAPRAHVTDMPLPTTTASTPARTEEPTPRMTMREPAAPTPVGADLTLERTMPPVEESTEVTATTPAPQPSTPPRPTSTSGSDEPPDPTPLLVAEAGRLIDGAEERDAIFEALCRGARAHLDFVALFMVHGETAVGRMGLADTWLSRDLLATLTVPLDKPSAFRTTVQTRAPYLGKLGEEGGAQTLLSLGRRPPLPALLLPLVLRDRTVAMLYGDAAGKPIDVGLLGELSTLSGAASRAFQRLILKQRVEKSGGGGEFKASAGGAAGKVNAAALSSTVSAPSTNGGGDDGKWRAAAGGVAKLPEAAAKRGGGRPRSTVLGFQPLSTEVVTAGAGPRDDGPAMNDADALVLSIIRDDQHARISSEALVLLGELGLEALMRHLPGPLRLDRHMLRGPTPPLGEHGALLATLSRFGERALPALVARANDPAVDVRFYVCLALGELEAPAAVAALGQRLFDTDASVRAVAAQALLKADGRAAQAPEVRGVLEIVRADLPGPDHVRQRMAAEAAGRLRDGGSVPRLVELVKHEDAALARAAHAALIEITKQDFGTSRWRWRGWWERHGDEPRLEWLLEGLAHSESEVRKSASDELRTMSPESFGYEFDAPKREREEARRRWVDWFRQKR